MHLRSGGIDVYYIDESHDRQVFVATAIRIPFLRQIEGVWQIVWPNHLAQAKAWRKAIKETLYIPTAKELHGVKLAGGRGNFLKGKHNFHKPQAAKAYRSILSSLPFIPSEGIMSASASRGKYLYGYERIEAAMYALFQRMRTQCSKANRNALTFFDQGHPEYRKLYRRAQVHLPTGSAFGGWLTGATKNMPLDMFTKDANDKNSKHCYFTQAADVIAYAAFMKLKGEMNKLEQWQNDLKLHTLYDAIPVAHINTKVSGSPKDGIVRLK
uniref:DUF3800 domain-containing protein n=1 Tax=Altererythrobacter segetis TaxID=1104773 RepID=UPI00140B9911|nr:DUF3800 domain-containing protein [Altererythrobacter segetis]